MKKLSREIEGYYKRYSHMAAMSRQEMDRVESFRTMKGWCRGKVLDVGCGLGCLTNYLGAVGTDKNGKIISEARELYPHLNFYVWDNGGAVIGGGFDTIVCYNLIEHIPAAERPGLFGEMARLLNRDGRIIFGYADPYGLLQLCKGPFSRSALFDPTHIYNWSVRGFERIIGETFDVLETRRTSPFTRWTWFGRYFKEDILMFCSAGKRAAAA